MLQIFKYYYWDKMNFYRKKNIYQFFETKPIRCSYLKEKYESAQNITNNKMDDVNRIKNIIDEYNNNKYDKNKFFIYLIYIYLIKIQVF